MNKKNKDIDIAKKIDISDSITKKVKKRNPFKMLYYILITILFSFLTSVIVIMLIISFLNSRIDYIEENNQNNYLTIPESAIEYNINITEEDSYYIPLAGNKEDYFAIFYESEEIIISLEKKENSEYLQMEFINLKNNNSNNFISILLDIQKQQNYQLSIYTTGDIEDYQFNNRFYGEDLRGNTYNLSNIDFYYTGYFNGIGPLHLDYTNNILSMNNPRNTYYYACSHYYCTELTKREYESFKNSGLINNDDNRDYLLYCENHPTHKKEIVNNECRDIKYYLYSYEDVKEYTLLNFDVSNIDPDKETNIYINENIEDYKKVD